MTKLARNRYRIRKECDAFYVEALRKGWFGFRSWEHVLVERKAGDYVPRGFASYPEARAALQEYLENPDGVIQEFDA